MKTFLSLFLVFSAAGASAVELHLATNRQILQELNRRLDNGGGGTGESATVSYLCDGSGYLKIEAINSKGEVKSDSKYLGNYNNCNEQVGLLNQNKSRVYALTVFALCDNSGYLAKYSVDEKAALKSVSSNYLGNYAACLPQAKQINGSNF